MSQGKDTDYDPLPRRLGIPLGVLVVAIMSLPMLGDIGWTIIGLPLVWLGRFSLSGGILTILAGIALFYLWRLPWGLALTRFWVSVRSCAGSMRQGWGRSCWVLFPSWRFRLLSRRSYPSRRLPLPRVKQEVLRHQKEKGTISS